MYKHKKGQMLLNELFAVIINLILIGLLTDAKNLIKFYKKH